MTALDYKEIAADLREVAWDIEDARYTDIKFSEDRFEALKKLYNRCEVFMAEFEAYNNFYQIN